MGKRDYETLDAIVIIGSMVIVAGMILGFYLVKDIKDAVLPILASLATAIFGLPVAYGAFRWGNNVGAKHAAEAAAETSKAATGALAQIAGASPQVASPVSDGVDG